MLYNNKNFLFYYPSQETFRMKLRDLFGKLIVALFLLVFLIYPIILLIGWSGTG